MVSPGSALLSPRGKVLEHGMPRFFRRLAEGVFDEDDVRRRANELVDFVETARAQYGLRTAVALGYSNGANIAAAILLLRPQAFAGAILLRAMVPLAQPPKPDLTNKPVLISSGQRDPIIPASNSSELAAQLSRAGANVQHSVLPTGHELTQMDVTRSPYARRGLAAYGCHCDQGLSTCGIVQARRAPAKASKPARAANSARPACG